MELKTLTQWAKDARVPLKKQALWKAVKSGTLRASRPGGMWLVSESDMMEYLSRGGNGAANQVN